MKKNAFSVQANFEPVLASISGFETLENAVRDKEYGNNILAVAHGVAVEEFNTIAIAAGQTGSIKHMFEWGTVGINKGRSNMRMSPTMPAARLWKDNIQANGLKNAVIGFRFRESIAHVPRITKRDTGISTDVIKKMRADHVFLAKAAVMEIGTIVRVTRTQAEFLLIPIKKDIRPGTKPSDIARGYVLRKTGYNSQPGRESMGTFTELWKGFWESQGRDTIDRAIEQQVLIDFREEIEQKLNTAKSAKKPTKRVSTQIKAKNAELLKKVRSNSALRRTVLQNDE